jgi:hypothetical protein
MFSVPFPGKPTIAPNVAAWFNPLYVDPPNPFDPSWRA